MPAYVLFRLVDRGDPADPMSYLPGYPVSVMGSNQYLGKQILPKYGQIVITDMTPEQVAPYLEEWKQEIDWEFTGHDYTTDTHYLRVFVKPEFVSQSGIGKLSEGKVEAFLERWGGVLESFVNGEVTFRVNVTDAILSDGFWGLHVPANVLSEIGYESATGIHSMQLNYGGLPWTVSKLSGIVTSNGCTVTGHKPVKKTATFDCSRENVFSQFKQSVKEAVDGTFARRKWRLTQSAIDMIVAGGGSIELSKEQMIDLWHSRLID
ncbi:MAG: hypothetical protein QUT30_08215 [Acidobacteriota bacterium]|nr:hypothetical protein [Acidobacteriota bacterium]